MSKLKIYNPFLRPLHLCNSNDFTTTHYVQQASALIQNLQELIGLTREHTPGREKNFQLLRKTESAAAKRDESRKESERQLEHRLHGKFSKSGELEEPIANIISHIPCYQFPLFAHGKVKESKGWGYVDLLGCSPGHKPAVIELKKGGSPETPLRMIVEGLAYAIAVQEMWRQKDSPFRKKWLNDIIGASEDKLKEDLKEIDIIGLAPSEYWKRWDATANRHSKDSETWGAITQTLFNELKVLGFHVHFASIEEEETPDSELSLNLLELSETSLIKTNS